VGTPKLFLARLHGEVGLYVLPGDRDVVGYPVFERPLLFGSVDLAKVVDAGAEASRLPEVGSVQKHLGQGCGLWPCRKSKRVGAVMVEPYAHITKEARESEEDAKADLAFDRILRHGAFSAHPVPQRRAWVTDN
jgi:hypothetical protein